MSSEPSSSGLAVRVSGVSKTFGTRTGTVQALSSVSFEIEPGSFVSIVGSSGCGKSTLLRSLAGLETPSTGTIMLGAGTPDQRVRMHEIGMAFQDPALLPWRSVERNIGFALEVAKRPRDRGLVQQFIDLVGLTGFEKTRPAQLSGGMRQRVSIARALVLRPSLLLLDEPFGALDELMRQNLNEELQRIWMRERTTTVMVTHSVSEAVFLSDRIIVMSPRPGRILAIIDVPFERERQATITDSAEFAELSAQVSQTLRNLP